MEFRSKQSTREGHYSSRSASQMWDVDNNFRVRDLRSLVGDQDGRSAELGDSFIMEVNCDHRIVSLINERTEQVQQIPIDVSQCPLPWQLSIGVSGDIST